MSRSAVCCIALIAFAVPSLADQPAPPAETLIRLTVYPMGEPKPALRYLLLPELKEMNPGNPIQAYLRCFSEQQHFFFNKETCDRRDKFLTMPLKELPLPELQDYGRSALAQADWAARLDKPDWQILLKLKTDGVGLLLPDVQQMRMLANSLKVRFRAEVAMHRYDDALRTAKTMFALARHLGEHPTVIGGLVGVAIATIAIGPLEEMLEQPGCPNLYWALTNLPAPLVSFEMGMQGERVLVQGELRDIDESNPMSAEQISKVIQHLDDLYKMTNEKKSFPSVQKYVDMRAKDDGKLNAARRHLAEFGLSEERVQSFPAQQVILVDEKLKFEIRRDEVMKLMSLATWQVEQVGGPIGMPNGNELFDLFVPALRKVRRAQGRLEQRVALLRNVEGLRLFAADHDGRLPATLSEVAVPLPVDPYTGQPFRYQLDGQTGHLRGSPPRGEENVAAYNVHYAITIQK